MILSKGDQQTQLTGPANPSMVWFSSPVIESQILTNPSQEAEANCFLLLLKLNILIRRLWLVFSTSLTQVVISQTCIAPLVPPKATMVGLKNKQEVMKQGMPLMTICSSPVSTWMILAVQSVEAVNMRVCFLPWMVSTFNRGSG
eukprot:Lithocolla_globosa_v1_NODE_575_length_3704_cov_40.853110.p2 type:complete len:144 gc:universal NODE_575_length_3704_cov_40.853110:2516-2947(+)